MITLAGPLVTAPKVCEATGMMTLAGLVVTPPLTEDGEGLNTLTGHATVSALAQTLRKTITRAAKARKA